MARPGCRWPVEMGFVCVVVLALLATSCEGRQLASASKIGMTRSPDGTYSVLVFSCPTEVPLRAEIRDWSTNAVIWAASPSGNGSTAGLNELSLTGPPVNWRTDTPPADPRLPGAGRLAVNAVFPGDNQALPIEADDVSGTQVSVATWSFSGASSVTRAEFVSENERRCAR